MSDVGIGKLIEGESHRDAIHVAICPVVANDTLMPGQHIGFITGSTSVVDIVPDAIGIVDPFLRRPILKGQAFYMCLYPNTVTGMRHHWSHPALVAEVALVKSSEAALAIPLKTSDAVGFITKLAVEHGLDYDEFMGYVREYVRSGNDAVDGGRWEGQLLWGNDEFWNAYEEVTGTKVPKDDRGGVFSCSC